MNSFLDKFDNLINEVKKEDMEDGNCYNCGGVGFVGRECPVCHRIQKAEVPVEKTSFGLKYDNFIIPSEYQSETWDREKAIKTNNNSPDFINYVNELNNIHETFKKGRKPTGSYIVISPSGTSKKTWAYSCMKYALEKGLTVAPLLDTLEYKRLSLLSAERPKFKMFNKINFDEYLMADVVFLSVIKDEYCTEAYGPILTILDRRDRLGLPTIILSSFKLEILAKRDFTKSFMDLVELGEIKHSNKFPALIEYRR